MIKKIVYTLIVTLIVLGCSSNEESVVPDPVEKDPQSEDTGNSIGLPTVSTADVKDIGLSTVLLGGVVHTNGGGTISERGIVWSLVTNPTILDNKVAEGNGLGAFEVNQENLDPDNEYFIKAFATNEKGTAYGEEKTFKTLNNEISFDLNGLAYGQILHNVNDKLIYFFTHGLTISPNDYRLVSYDYVQNKVVNEVNIDPFFTYKTATLHGLGDSNGRREIYVASLTSISIRDAISLEEIDNFAVPDATRIHCVQQMNNRIYITYTNNNAALSSEKDNFAVFDRNTFDKISEVGPLFSEFSARFTIVRDFINPNLINCLTASNFTSNGNGTITINNYIFDENGIYKEMRIIRGFDGDKYPIRTNNNSKIILSGRRAKITDRLDSSSNNMEDTYLTQAIAADYEISPDGNTIYAITNKDVVKKFNATSFDVEQTINLNSELQEHILPGQDVNNIVVSDNEVIVLDYIDIPFEERHKVTMSIFPR